MEAHGHMLGQMAPLVPGWFFLIASYRITDGAVHQRIPNPPQVNSNSESLEHLGISHFCLPYGWFETHGLQDHLHLTGWKGWPQLADVTCEKYILITSPKPEAQRCSHLREGERQMKSPPAKQQS